jgi:hypothetical protein
MNLFQSEEHVRAWTQFDRSSEDGIRPLHELATGFFVLPRYRERLAPDYLLRVTELARDLPAALERLGRSSPFWRMLPPNDSEGA